MSQNFSCAPVAAGNALATASGTQSLNDKPLYADLADSRQGLE
jgi:hypothetical protein